MKLVSIIVYFICSSAFASKNSYDLKMDLSINGKHIASPRVFVKAGEMKTITQKTGNEESFIEVVATEGSIQDHKGILVNFAVGFISKNGERTIKAKPQLLAKENESTQITITENNGEVISLSVVAKRKSP